MNQLLPGGEETAPKASDLGLRQAGSVWISEDGTEPAAGRQAPANVRAPANVVAQGWRAGIARSLDRRP